MAGLKVPRLVDFEDAMFRQTIAQRCGLLKDAALGQMEPTYPNDVYLERYLEATEKWQTRPRDLEDEGEAMSRVD